MDLITSKDLVTSSQITRRANLHKIHRNFLGAGEWSRQKTQLQTIANKSFQALQNKLVQQLYTFVKQYLKAEDKEEKHTELYAIFHDFFKKSYFLGVKSAGAGLVAHTFSFAHDIYGKPKIYETETLWSAEATKLEQEFWVEFLKKVDRFISKSIIQQYVQCLDSHYLAGRVVGAPTNSIIYWIMPENHPHCAMCEQLQYASPIDKECMITTPRGGLCTCGKLCTCKIKIVPKQLKTRSSLLLAQLSQLK